MTSQEEKDRALRFYPQGNLESPFLEEELFAEENGSEWEARLAALEAESSFRHAFTQGQTTLIEPEELEEEFVEEDESPWEEDEFPEDEAEAYHEEALADLEDSLKEVYDEDEAQYGEGEIGKEKALARMKFEFQTGNKIWRNDGKTESLLGRKYGPDDFLVNKKKKGVRLESESNGVLEFETEWFRRWPKLRKAIGTAVSMTEDMNSAGPAKYNSTRKAFPFSVDHLRIATAKERDQGFWDRRPGMESGKEKPLREKEELEVELSFPMWKAGIQSSECFLLEYYESFLKQHEWRSFRDGAIRHSKAILDDANTDGTPITELAKLRSFLQIIVNYIMRGRGGKESKDAGAFADVKGMPAKQAFTLMNRTNFASMYRSLLTKKEKNLFRKIVKTDMILNEIGLNQQSPVFIKGYGTKRHEPGPTVHQWLSEILNGVDLLSARSGKGLSAAMGRYPVETRSGKKDRWLVKFETRNTIMGAVQIGAKDWVKYASKLFDLASKRERHAVYLASKQGIADENSLTDLVFHARHPQLRGRQIRRGERNLAQQWLRIRNDLVRPSLQGVQPELDEIENIEDHYERSHHFNSNLEECAADDEAEDAELEDEEMEEERKREKEPGEVREADGGGLNREAAFEEPDADAIRTDKMPWKRVELTGIGVQAIEKSYQSDVELEEEERSLKETSEDVSFRPEIVAEDLERMEPELEDAFDGLEEEEFHLENQQQRSEWEFRDLLNVKAWLDSVSANPKANESLLLFVRFHPQPRMAIVQYLHHVKSKRPWAQDVLKEIASSWYINKLIDDIVLWLRVENLSHFKKDLTFHERFEDEKKLRDDATQAIAQIASWRRVREYQARAVLEKNKWRIRVIGRDFVNDILRKDFPRLYHRIKRSEVPTTIYEDIGWGFYTIGKQRLTWDARFKQIVDARR